MTRLSRIATVFAIVLAGFSASRAEAASDGAAGPLATARLERLARFVAALDAPELGALGRAHEGYLDRFRAEIAPDAEAVLARSVDLQPGDEGFAEFLGELDRLAGRIAAADEAFFTEAAVRLGDARREAVGELAAARERQRLTRGFRTEAVRALGNGTEFVDLVDLASREAAPAEQAPLAEFARAESARLTVEARSFDLARRQALARWITEMRAFERSDRPEALADSIRTATDAGRELRRILRDHHAANRAALARLAPLVGEARSARIRERAALRALGESAFRALGNDRSAMLESIVARSGLEAEPVVAAAAADWRAARASALEEFIEGVDAADLPSWASMASPDAAEPPGGPFDRAREALVAADAAFADAIAAALGERAEQYLERHDGSDPMLADLGLDAGPARWIPRSTDTPGGAGDDAATPADEAPTAGARPISRTELSEVLALTATEADAALVDGVHAAWSADRWEAEVAPADAAFRAAVERAGGMSDDSLPGTGAAASAVREAGERRLAAIEGAERALASDLRGALALDEDAPAATLLSLIAFGRVDSGAEAGAGLGDMAVVPDPLRVLVRARATPAEVRALLADDPPAWRALAAEAQPARRRLLVNLERALRLEADFPPGAAGNIDRIRARTEELARDHAAIVDRLRESLAARLEDAGRMALATPERRAALDRALQREAFPGYFAAAASAERQLDGALALADLDDELRVEIEVLRAEYLAVLDDRSARIIALAREDARTPDAPREVRATRAAEIARLGAERSERTERSLVELRRLLGDERARRVPGLVRPTGAGPARSAWEIVVGDD